MLLAAIRDYLIELGDAEGAAQYQADFLIKYDPPSGSYKPRLSLNVQDDDYFHNLILLPHKRPVVNKGIYSSHERIEAAAQIAATHVRDITGGLSAADRVRRLYEWIEYLKETALVIVVTVPASVGNSFKMFETLERARSTRHAS